MAHEDPSGETDNDLTHSQPPPSPQHGTLRRRQSKGNRWLAAACVLLVAIPILVIIMVSRNPNREQSLNRKEATDATARTDRTNHVPGYSGRADQQPEKSVVPVRDGSHAMDESTAPVSMQATEQPSESSPIEKPHTDSPATAPPASESADSRGSRSGYTFEQAINVLKTKTSLKDFSSILSQFVELGVVEKVTSVEAGSYGALFEGDVLTDLLRCDGASFYSRLTGTTYKMEDLRGKRGLWFREAAAHSNRIR